MVKKEIIEIVKNFINAMKSKSINVNKVLLFGSFANEKDSLWSDIDIAVISSDFGKDRFVERTLLTGISYKIDPRIEPYPIGQYEFEEEDWKTMIHEIKLNGIEIAAWELESI